ncbi:MAG TPA: haloacid dehalogenase-like hydrolase, partial [Vicinamibacterales bacterium]|nr:haloacid dehalogenase-like hydrolase [Vicinamibacterales bacterium]
MKTLFAALASLLVVLSVARPPVGHAASQAGQNNLIAIDVLLEPDQTMVAKANALNARLRNNYPNGYSLDATHAPHVTMLQRFVRAQDFDAVTAAITKVLAVERPTDLQLTAKGLEYTIWAGVAVTVITIERTPELVRLQQKVADAVAPFAASGGTAAAFIDTPPNAEIVGYVETFVPKASGAAYFPHVTAGVATEAFVKQLKAQPFDTFTFKPAGVGIYQLGNFGTASKKLWPTKPLASWNDGPPKRSILDFVRRATTAGSPDFVPVSERIAVFDNDGTLWPEQPPISFQGQFVFDRVRALAPHHPEWKDTQPFKGVIDNDLEAVAASGEAGLIDMVVATHSGMTTDEFDRIVKEWLATARHPKFNRPYTDLAYQPMLEVLSFLRANEFKTYIVSGGGVEFMRTFSERVYGVPPEQVIGSSVLLKYEVRNGTPVLMRQPKVDFIDDKDGKVVGIQKFIGRRPIAAFGNSDGDFAMLEWVTAGSGPRF